MCFRCFDSISRSDKNVALYFNKLEFPSPSLRILCAQFGWNWPNGCEEEYIIKISKYGQCISLFRHYITLGKRVSLHLNKIEFPSPKNASCQIRLKKFRWFWRSKCEKFTDKWTNDGWQAIRKAHLSFQRREAKKLSHLKKKTRFLFFVTCYQVLKQVWQSTGCQFIPYVKSLYLVQ